MENVIVIEQKTFEELMARFNRLAGMVDRFCRKAEEKRLSEWLDSTEVCQILQISPRTLQTLRDRRQIPFTVLGNRLLLYPESGIRAVLDRNIRPAAE